MAAITSTASGAWLASPARRGRSASDDQYVEVPAWHDQRVGRFDDQPC